MKVIGHIDADSFYVSCERVRDKRLCNRPVAVLGNQGACVIARSYEMKPFGVTVGMPIWQAKKLCPEGIYIKRDFRWYGVLSKMMQDVLATYSDEIEYYSVDESFVNFGIYRGDLQQLGLEIQRKIMKEVQVPVSVGLAKTRKLAKLGSDCNKPLGVTVFTDENLYEYLAKIPVGEISGIGGRLVQRLYACNVKTVLDFAKLDRDFVKKLLHKPGEELWYEINGKSILGIRTEKPLPKSLSRGGSIWGHHEDKDYVWGFVLRNLERFMDAIWKANLFIADLTLILCFSDGGAVQSCKTLTSWTDSYEKILKNLREIFEENFVVGEKYCRVHIYSSKLRYVKGSQQSLFELESKQQKQIKELKSNLNKKFGMFAVRSASTAFANTVFKDTVSNFEICDIEGKFCF